MYPSLFYATFTKCCFEDQLSKNFNCNKTVTQMKKGKIIHLQLPTISNTVIWLLLFVCCAEGIILLTLIKNE